MQWQRLLSAAAAIVGVAAVGCDSAPSLHAADLGLPPAALVQPAGDSTGVRMQKAEGDVKRVANANPDPDPEPLGTARVVVTVRALVNGVPIFDDEVTVAARIPLASIQAATEEERKIEAKKIKDAVLDQIIERELLVQEAEHKLKLVGKKDVLEKVREDADEDFQQRVKKMRASFKSDEDLANYFKMIGTSLE